MFCSKQSFAQKYDGATPMNLIESTYFGLEEALYQLSRNLVQVTKQVYGTSMQYVSQVNGKVSDYMDGLIIKPMTKQHAKQILNANSKEEAHVRYQKLRELNKLSPFMQCKIDEAYGILK